MALAVSAVRTAQAQADIDPQRVRAAIARGMEYLLREQLRDGSWKDWPSQEGGVTALCTLALLNGGLPPSDPRVQRALSVLRKIETDGTYAVALQTMAFCEAEPEKDLLLIRRNVQWLESNQFRNGPTAGSWSYPQGPGDNSNSQFALLALHAAEEVGVAANDTTWRLAQQYWSKCQNGDGSWAYTIAGGAGTGSMTCAGITSMVICTGRLAQGDARVEGGRALCCQQQEVNDSIERGLSWLARNFSVEINPGAGGRRLYYLYALERVGRLTAQRFIGDHDWYREGVAEMLKEQDQLSGFWRGDQDGPEVVATSFVLLFLSKGRWPVLVGKLTHGPEGDWNRHRNDIANLTHYAGQKWRQKMTWQVVQARTAKTVDLLQAPVLFFNGREAPVISDEEVARLREYVNQGGFIFAEACCEGDAFDQGFRALVQRLFPEPEHQLHLLPPEHPVWRAEEPVDPKYVRPLWGIDVGCRTSVIYCPADLSCYWELSRPGRDTKLPPAVRVEVAAANALGINVLAYATNRELKSKDELLAAVREPGADDRVARGKLAIGKLKHTGGWNVAPTALSNLGRALARELKIRIDSAPHEFPLTDPRIYDFHLLFMHGRNSFRFSEAERQQLRAFVERGGTLLADSVCGSEEFTRAFRREMEATFPETPLERVPAGNPLLTNELGGFDLKQVQRREPQAGDGALRGVTRSVEPDLEGIRQGERYAVIFSRFDLSCALEKHNSVECAGYTPEDAARIGINVVLYSLQQ
ncbi:MAG: DUF4159 domain-containing protein [Pirellulales bacterium]|nr:DUF4159 domain-containing protein [Pirellulales bacterium]